MFQLLKECEGAANIVISGHIRPDGDCVGSCMATYLFLKKTMPKADIRIFLEQPADIFSCIQDFDLIDTTFQMEAEPDVFIALDCEKTRLGEAEKIFDKAKKTINIDHHISNEHGCGDVNYIDPKASSASELVYDVLDEKTYVQNQILGRALLESILFMDGKCVVSYIDQKTMKFYDVTSKDLEGIVSQLRIIKGVECAIFMYETSTLQYKVSLRSCSYVDVSKVAEYFGGGGHKRAAGCTINGTFYDVVNNLSEQIEKQM